MMRSSKRYLTINYFMGLLNISILVELSSSFQNLHLIYIYVFDLFPLTEALLIPILEKLIKETLFYSFLDFVKIKTTLCKPSAIFSPRRSKRRDLSI